MRNFRFVLNLKDFYVQKLLFIISVIISILKKSNFIKSQLSIFSKKNIIYQKILPIIFLNYQNCQFLMNEDKSAKQ